MVECLLCVQETLGSILSVALRLVFMISELERRPEGQKFKVTSNYVARCLSLVYKLKIKYKPKKTL